ncbi:hypothetical protein BGV40_06535 [Methanosarcina sp. Ant1]|nr:hypothetical protein BGV40_06535 [Methanosarcina sp. Ant1]
MQQKSKLPEGWTWADMSDIFVWANGKSLPKKNMESGNYLVYGGNGINGHHTKWLSSEECIVIGRVGANCGNIHLAKSESWITDNAIYSSWSSKNISLKYFLFVLSNCKLNEYSSGSGQPYVSQKTLASQTIMLPPFAEQHRNVSAIEELFARLDATNEKLDRVLEILKKLRQSVLTSAFDGKLTEDWRIIFQNSNGKNEIFQKNIHVNSSYLSEKPMIPDNELLPILPNSWFWATIEQLASIEPRSIQSGPFGSNLLHSEFQETGVLAIGIDNVLYRSFSLGKEHRISNEKYHELKKYTTRPLDVLITVMATVGRCCVVPQDIETAIITKHVYRITPNREVISSYYLMNALSGAATVKEQIDNQIRGQTRPGINGKILKATSIPLPPLPEQQEIVKRIDALFAFADSIEAKVKAAREKTEKLRQSILAKAFSGELVPTEAEIAKREGRDYETAEVLLERIKEERRKSGKKR